MKTDEEAYLACICAPSQSQLYQNHSNVSRLVFNTFSDGVFEVSHRAICAALILVLIPAPTHTPYLDFLLSWVTLHFPRLSHRNLNNDPVSKAMAEKVPNTAAFSVHLISFISGNVFFLVSLSLLMSPSGGPLHPCQFQCKRRFSSLGCHRVSHSHYPVPLLFLSD